MPKQVYNKRMIEWIQQTYQKHSASEIADMFNGEFGFKRTTEQIKSVLSNRKITTKRGRGDALKGRLKLLTKEQHEFVESAYKRTTIANVTKELNESFGLNVKESQIRSYTRNHKMKSGRTGHFEQGSESWNKGKKGWQAGGRSVETQFKPRSVNPDYRAFNQAEVGDEVIDTYGYRKRKIAQPNKWEFCHVLLWRENHGEVPDGYIVRFLDNDKANITIDNLHLVSRGANAVLNKQQKKVQEFEPGARKAVVAVAELRAKIAQIRP